MPYRTCYRRKDRRARRRGRRRKQLFGIKEKAPKLGRDSTGRADMQADSQRLADRLDGRTDGRAKTDYISYIDRLD